MRGREQAAWGVGRSSPVAEVTSEDLAAVHQRACQDLKWFYVNVLQCQNPRYQQSLGAFHNLGFDFLRWEELRKLPAKCRNTNLVKWLPKPDGQGIHPERWLYFPTLDAEPRIEDGPGCELERMFHSGELMSPSHPGVLIRIKDDGRVKSVLWPRGHLKSEIANFALNMQDIIRDPSIRIMVRSGEDGLAEKLIASIKRTIEINPEFQTYWGTLGPPQPKEEVWSKSAMQVLSEVRQSEDPTIVALGMKSSATGKHCNKAVFDDVVTLQNEAHQEPVINAVQDMIFVTDPGFKALDIGTLYRENDAHALFIRPTGGLYDFCSFMVATVLDANNKPIWPEVVNDRELSLRRAMCKGSDYRWFCQYWNNPYLAKVEGFHSAWWQEYTEPPVELAVREHLNIYMTVDTASQVRKANDFTAVVVQGQTKDAASRYILDGIRDKIPYDRIAEELVSRAKAWQQVARRGGGSFRFGIEQVAFIEHLQNALRDEMRRQGVSFAIEPLKHGNKPKPERIRRLMNPYSNGAIWWPAELPQAASDGSSYDFVAVYKDAWIKFPRCAIFDHLDAHAYGEDLLRPLPAMAKQERQPEAPRSAEVDPGRGRSPADLDKGRTTGRYVPKLARLAREGGRPRYTGRYVPGGQA